MSITSIAGILYGYFHQFNGVISADQATWGTFGDYVGGTINSIFAFLSFIALLITIYLQSNALEETRKEMVQTKEIADDQKNHFIIQSTKDDLIKVISIVEHKIDNIFISDSQIENYYNTPLNKFFSIYGPGQYFDKLINKTHLNSPSIIFLVEQLNDLQKYVTMIEKLDSNLIIVEYYKIKYKFLYNFLHQMDAIDNKTIPR